MANIPAIHTATDDYVSSIATRCPDVLAAVGLLPAGSVNGAVVFAVFEEAGGDLAVASHAPMRTPFAKMASTLTQLHWSSPQTGETIRRYVSAQRRLFRLAPSHLCTDLRALAASIAQQTPDGTLRWLAKLGRAATAQGHQLTAFVNVLDRFQTPADAGLVSDSNRLLRQFNADFKSSLNPEIARLITVLGVPS